MTEDPLQRLRGFGLNQLEAEVYLKLLVNPPVTAYRMAKLLDRPVANVYKAFDGLLSKGAVLTDNAKNKVYTAVLPDEFLGQLQNGFNSRIQDTKEALKGLQKEFVDEKVYEIESVELALEKARRMIESANQVVIVDAFPKPMSILKEAISAAVARGVEVHLQSYGPFSMEGADIAFPKDHQRILEYWNGQQMNVASDGKEYILTLFDDQVKKVFQGAWSQNLYLSVIVHAGLLSEFKLHKLEAFEDVNELKAYLRDQKFFHNSTVPGVQELFQRFRK